MDTAAALGQFTIEQLIGLAKHLDPGLTDRDFADAGRQLDRMPDGLFARYGLSPADVATVRDRFKAWPRNSPGWDRPPSAYPRRLRDPHAVRQTRTGTGLEVHPLCPLSS